MMKADDPRQSERVQVRLDPETRALLDRLAREEKETISNYLRRLIRAQGKKEKSTDSYYV